MSLVIAIDVGIKNLAICAYDFISSKVVHWDNVSLVPNGRYVPAQNVQYVREFVQRHSHLFQAATVVIVERQMRCNMRIIEAVFQSMFYERCCVVHARSVKMHYGLSTRNYRANKAKAVEWVKQSWSMRMGNCRYCRDCSPLRCPQQRRRSASSYQLSTQRGPPLTTLIRYSHSTSPQMGWRG